MSEEPLLQFEPLDRGERATLVVDLSVRSPHRVNPLLYGKFCEHLGRNINCGMEAQIVSNPRPASPWIMAADAAASPAPSSMPARM